MQANNLPHTAIIYLLQLTRIPLLIDSASAGYVSLPLSFSSQRSAEKVEFAAQHPALKLRCAWQRLTLRKLL
ncbi:hypothetical protein [Erwinia sp. HR93]|uniref:hypothetical protein n=1 Tax=Erwinia sp. HR93 TaxID=3094840 RepID=UPI002ADEF465|nr:hypothetical protein [Erwinia sp. HR93]MEA1063213.1 hypothetical protein [Erwinia sp. HR93]